MENKPSMLHLSPNHYLCHCDHSHKSGVFKSQMLQSSGVLFHFLLFIKFSDCFFYFMHDSIHSDHVCLIWCPSIQKFTSRNHTSFFIIFNRKIPNIQRKVAQWCPKTLSKLYPFMISIDEQHVNKSWCPVCDNSPSIYSCSMGSSCPSCSVNTSSSHLLRMTLLRCLVDPSSRLFRSCRSLCARCCSCFCNRDEIKLVSNIYWQWWISGGLFI